MQVFAYRPKHPDLQDCVDCIYILRQSENEFCRYISFPSVFTNLSILKSAALSYTEKNILIEERKNAHIQCIIRKNLLNPCFVEYKGSIEEFTIFFKPLGINHFPDLNKLASVPDKFIHFIPEAKEEEMWQRVFSENELRIRIETIENYLAAQKKSFYHPFLEKAIELANQQPSMNNEDLAAILKISRKTLHHHFEQYLGLSPSQFRRINRFRKSIKEKQEKKDAGSLTELAYSLDYFDQSHMIREIRSMTGFIPKDFYKNIKQFEDTSITWIIQ